MTDRPGRTPVARRLAALPVAVLLVSALAFALPDLTGLDPARATLRARSVHAEPDADVLADLDAELGTDRPLPLRYAAFLADAAGGDLGRSSTTRRPVVEHLVGAAQVSVGLVLAAMTLALVVALPLGLLAASRAGTAVDRLATAGCRLAVAVPEYVLGPALVLALAIHLGLLPSAGWSSGQHVVLPALCLAVYPIGVLTQLVRADALDTLGAAHIRTARAAGVPERRVLLRHVGRLSLVSAVAVAGSLTAGMLGGAVMVEVVFGVPGLGRLLHDAVLAADVPMVQGALLVVVPAALGIGLVADALHRMLDPRVRLP